jgi:pyruvate,water dikinase
MPLRESGRATFLRTYDVARHATRAIGRHLVADGLLDDEADVFYLTLDELTSARTPNDARSLVPARRGLREHYQTISLPNLWTGVPTPSIVIEDESEPGLSEPFTGQGVSAGIAEGTVRVILDPTDSDDINEGDVLVCRATDPSWATLFYLASAVIMDLGGDMSHGAIVARELGLPAVVNTRDGTRRLRNGDHVRVDGSAGTVTPMPTGHGAALSARDRDVQRTDRSRSE